MKCYYKILITVIFFDIFFIECNGNAIFGNKGKQSPSSILVDVAKELVERSKNSNQVKFFVYQFFFFVT